MKQRIRVFILHNGTVLLLHRIKNGKEYYAVPGGGVEVGETEQETAAREIKEETGLTITLGQKIGVININGSDEHFYIAEEFQGEPRLGSPEKERRSPDNIYRLEWVPLENMDRIALREEIKTLLLKYLNMLRR